MKKISLKNLDSFNMEILSKNELKKVIGGSSAECGVQGGGAMCPPGLCCSTYGYCGNTSPYCVEGCQSQCTGDWTTFECRCYDSGITWVAKYKDAYTMADYIYNTCESGGACFAV